MSYTFCRQCGWFIYVSLIIASPALVAETSKNPEFSRALAAFKRSEYHTARPLFKKLAENGQAEAQRYLGKMFDKGLGVPQNYHKAITWYRKAAQQRDPAAQYHLGLKYANGHGVKKNESQAYIWFAISFNNGYQPAADPLRVLNKSMSTLARQKALNVVVQQMEKYAVK
ncbi:MAG: tetratricopeptide repeat protein [Gammaproteobacteria bacterium]|jgi:TPR repeat protein